jgi:hypothetical protein
MRHNTVQGLIRDAQAAMLAGRAALAYRLLVNADRMATADKTFPTVRRDAIRAARMLTCSAI